MRWKESGGGVTSPGKGLFYLDRPGFQSILTGIDTLAITSDPRPKNVFTLFLLTFISHINHLPLRKQILQLDIRRGN